MQRTYHLRHPQPIVHESKLREALLVMETCSGLPQSPILRTTHKEQKTHNYDDLALPAEVFATGNYATRRLYPD